MLYKGHSDILLYALPRFLVSKSAHRGSTQIPNIERLRFELRCRRAFQAPCGALLGVLEIRDPQNHRLRLQNCLILDDLGGYPYSQETLNLPSGTEMGLGWIPSDSNFGCEHGLGTDAVSPVLFLDVDDFSMLHFFHVFVLYCCFPRKLWNIWKHTV